MTISIFIDDLEELLVSVTGKKIQGGTNFNFAEDCKEDATRLGELLEDLTDFARANSAFDLTSKLAALSEDEDQYGFRTSLSPSELEARILRILRAVRTFGGELLGKERMVEPITAVGTRDLTKSKTKRVFVVHGHDDSAVHEVSRLLEGFGLEPVVLREQASKGKTIIEKFESNSDVGFAVILMTSDDMGASIENAEKGHYEQRARQNVILEMGYFIAHLKRERVCVLKARDVEEPSDIFGVVYTEIDGAGAWRVVLAKELKAAGYQVDLNRL